MRRKPDVMFRRLGSIFVPADHASGQSKRKSRQCGLMRLRSCMSFMVRGDHHNAATVWRRVHNQGAPSGALRGLAQRSNGGGVVHLVTQESTVLMAPEFFV